MKLIVNKCYGGFGLSRKAQIEYFKTQGGSYPFVVSYNDDCKSSFERYDENKSYERFKSFVLFKENPIGDVLHITWEEADEKYKMLDSDFDEKRTDKTLVEIVERLESAANGSFSSLKVVEIPDGYDYKIHDYDGVETVYAGKDLQVF